MYVCLCNRVNDRQIKRLARQGVSSLTELQECTSLGVGCGCCLLEAQEILEEHQSEPSACGASGQRDDRESIFPANGSPSFEPAV